MLTTIANLDENIQLFKMADPADENTYLYSKIQDGPAVITTVAGGDKSLTGLVVDTSEMTDDEIHAIPAWEFKDTDRIVLVDSLEVVTRRPSALDLIAEPLAPVAA